MLFAKHEVDLGQWECQRMNNEKYLFIKKSNQIKQWSAVKEHHNYYNSGAEEDEYLNRI